MGLCGARAPLARIRISIDPSWHPLTICRCTRLLSLPPPNVSHCPLSGSGTCDECVRYSSFLSICLPVDVDLDTEQYTAYSLHRCFERRAPRGRLAHCNDRVLSFHISPCCLSASRSPHFRLHRHKHTNTQSSSCSVFTVHRLPLVACRVLHCASFVGFSVVACHTPPSDH